MMVLRQNMFDAAQDITVLKLRIDPAPALVIDRWPVIRLNFDDGAPLHSYLLIFRPVGMVRVV
jgi:hypothetical protein